MAENLSDRYKVRLQSQPNPDDLIIFNVTPELSESKSVTYQSLEPVHLPGNILVYGNSGARTFTLVAKFISRNLEEATNNSKHLQLLRSWTMPYFGNSSFDMIGSPPDVLYLTAYSNHLLGAANKTNNINRIPTVLSNLSLTYPSDVDYVPTRDGEPFPVLLTVDISLSETHSPQGFTNFSLSDYKNGIMPNF